MNDADISWTDQTWINDVGQRYYIAPVSPLFFTVSRCHFDTRSPSLTILRTALRPRNLQQELDLPVR